MKAINKKYYTVSKADVFNVSLGKVVFSVEASHINRRAVVFGTDNLQVKNAINLLEHETLKDAHEYIDSLMNDHSVNGKNI